MPILKDLIPDQEMEPRVFLRTMGVLIWVSFLFAGVGSGLFFATFDPVEIAAIATFAMTLDPLTGYTNATVNDVAGSITSNISPAPHGSVTTRDNAGGT